LKDLALEVQSTRVPPGCAALWWLAQAGFVFKSADDTVTYLDAYLSDAVEAAFGFKRLSLAPIGAEHVRANWVVSSHEHLDHLDTDALPIMARNNPKCRFAGPEACRPIYAECAIEADRQVILMPSLSYDLGRIKLYTAKADHGDLSPSALAFLFDFGQVRVLFTGDTAFAVDLLQPLIERKPDVLIPCINGAFGNMDSDQAARLTSIVRPRLAIPCHFWMFAEHGGDPRSFIEACAEQCPQLEVRLLSPGDGLLVTAQSAARIER
jgi:L-ascorbate 6-phosphate lactonase